MHSHQGYVGNELADQAAKHAQWWSQQCNPKLIQQINDNPFVKSIKDIHKETQAYWDNQWQSNSNYFPSNSKIWCMKILPTLDDAIDFNRLLQKLSPYLVKPISRLASGYCNLRAPQFKWKLVNSPNCLHCKVPETIEHYLFECTKFDDIREDLFENLRICWLKSTPTQPPTSFSSRTIITAYNFHRNQQLEALQALGEFIRLSRVNL